MQGGSENDTIAHGSISFSLVILVGIASFSACTRQPSYSPPPVTGSAVVVDISTLRPDVPKFYTYRHEGKNISFFVLRLDQKVLSFLDACASCYPHKQGYRPEEASVICRYCNMKFSLYKLERGLGGCYPIKLEGRIENGKYLIPVPALEKAADRF